MATHRQLTATTRYLRFPFAPDHRTRLQDGSECPHCHGKHVQKWGSFSSRQRYRCRGCGRTFSTFTGTALCYLKRPDRWRRFLWCVDGRLTVRTSAAVLGVHKDTALRWRHRLLDQWRKEPKPRLKGRIVVGDFSIPHSAKGSRSLARPARVRGEPWGFPSTQTGPVTVLVAWASPTAMVIKKVGVRRLRAGDYDEQITPRVRDATEIVGFRGPMCALAGFAGRIGASYSWERRSFSPTQVFLVRRELRAWLKPFKGVSTRRLDNYLEWFRRRGGSREPTVPADRVRVERTTAGGRSGSSPMDRTGTKDSKEMTPLLALRHRSPRSPTCP